MWLQGSSQRCDDGGVIWWWNNVSVGVVRHPTVLAAGTIPANDRGCDNLTERRTHWGYCLAAELGHSPLSAGIASTISRYYTRLSALKYTYITQTHTQVKVATHLSGAFSTIQPGCTTGHFVLDNILKTWYVSNWRLFFKSNRFLWHGTYTFHISCGNVNNYI